MARDDVSSKQLRFVRLRTPADASSERQEKLPGRASRDASGDGAGAPRARREAPPPGTSAIDAYLARVPADRRAALEQVRATIRAALPRAEECISYGMPAFRVEGVVVAGFLATAQGCSYYPFSGKTLATLAASLAGYSRTKSALHFAADRPLPATLIRKLLRARRAEARHSHA